ncbi:hypothetical protein [Alienimonas californiensis]|uniref:Uncharacterized protein n=1 Tax=Alienimonas californiensis TaxID=2527989 RepID=A0A517P4X2_9PLAN|nr:hypothetical protein [Alienimonas californiensis]QDT14396.1 hypothetical protein CA12_04690 [Alienimonas californiensis]
MFDPPFPPDRTPPHRLRCDVAVLGAGFGGSLIACCLRACGRSVALIDSGRLPRFALGETLTPYAAALLTALAERYRLNWLPPLLDPADGDRGGPGVRSGRHRGTVWAPVGPVGGNGGGEEAGAPLIVPAVGLGGALWHRGDVDAFAAARAVAADAVFFDRTALHSAERRSGGGYLLTGTRDERGVAPAGFVHKPDSPVRIEADFLIDAGPPGGTGRTDGDAGLAGLLGLPDGLSTLASRTRLTFAHLSALDPPNLPIADQNDPADEAIVHHVFADGWYRELRFADGTASVARSGLFEEPVPGVAGANGDGSNGAWADPFRLVGWGGLAERHGRSVHAAPETGPCSPGRFQRRVGRVAGADYALLPAAAAAIDPLHDTDLTHTAAAVLRLGDLLDSHWGRPSQAAALERYAATLDRELTRIDGLAAPAYAALGDWETFRLAVQLHDAAAADLSADEEGGEFLLAENADFTAAASDFAAGVGRRSAAELAAALRARLPHAADRFGVSA